MAVKMDSEFKRKRFLYVIVVPIAIFVVAFILTLLGHALVYMWMGFFIAWAVHFYTKHIYSQKEIRKKESSQVN